eukprot:g9176.t1
MVSARHRTKVAALTLAAASLGSNHAVDAFYSATASPLAFAPLQAQPWLAAPPLAARQSVSSSSASGRPHRLHVRGRSVFQGSSCLRSEKPAGVSDSRAARGTWVGAQGGRRGSKLAMAVVEDTEETSTSASGTGPEAAVAVEPFMPAAIQDALPEGVQKELSKINSDPAKLTLALNAVVIFLFAAFAAYKVATVDGDIARGWTWYEVLLRVPGDNFYRYEATVSESPIPTKALTSCVAYGLGDFTAQLFTGKNLETIDLKRTARSATAGLLVHGPLCHFWIELMQTYLDFDGAWWNFIPKVIADQTVWSVFLNAAYSTMIMSLQGLPREEVWNQVKTTAWPALTSSWRFWPLIHCCSFSNAIPKDLKLLFIDCMEIIWVTILSTVANGDRQADSSDDGEMVPALAGGAVLQPGEMEMEIAAEKPEKEPIHH